MLVETAFMPMRINQSHCLCVDSHAYILFPFGHIKLLKTKKKLKPPEAPILWPPDVKSQLTVKGPDAGKNWRQKEKGAAEEEVVGWHHRLNGHEFEQTLGDGEGQGSLVCCSPWGHKELDTTEQLNGNWIITAQLTKV